MLTGPLFTTSGNNIRIEIYSRGIQREVTQLEVPFATVAFLHLLLILLLSSLFISSVISMQLCYSAGIVALQFVSYSRSLSFFSILFAKIDSAHKRVSMSQNGDGIIAELAKNFFRLITFLQLEIFLRGY